MVVSIIYGVLNLTIRILKKIIQLDEMHLPLFPIEFYAYAGNLYSFGHRDPMGMKNIFPKRSSAEEMAERKYRVQTCRQSGILQ